ncbi:MAG: RDD family protein, partial [Syntrophobacterales bacterium]|nr:RDD family protein [Syntrophobacterales bacterium]
GFWQRFVALSIDIVILYIFTIILFMIGNLIVPFHYDSMYLADTSSALIYAVFFPYYGMAVLVNAAYFIYFHGTTGQTPGKKLLDLKVVRTDGKPMTLGTAFLRWVGYIISKLPFFLGFIWVAFDGRKQGWHDKIAGTYVIKTRRYQEIKDTVPPDAPLGPTFDNYSDKNTTYGKEHGYGALKEARFNGKKT